MEMKAAKKDLIYLYCLTNRVPKLKEVESLANSIYFVCKQGLYAIASRVKESEFGEKSLKKNLADLEWIKTKANIHEKIIEGIMKHACVMPFKFATLFNGEDSLKTMLKVHMNKFKAVLKSIEDKEEWGVKVYCDMKKLKKSFIQKDEQLIKIDEEISSSSAGKAFFLKKKKEELLNTIISEKINDYGENAIDVLSKQSERRRINKLLPKEVTEREDDMILNAAFLLEKNKVNIFINTVNALKAKYAFGLFFDCTGPWPPYNFCEQESNLNG